MKVVKLSIENFRGIQSTELLFDGHTLLVGSNNVGKSTLCEALDLVLGPERLNRFPPIDEFDFYNARYLAATANGGDPAPIPLRIEAVIIGLSAEIDAKCGGHIEFWHLPTSPRACAWPPSASTTSTTTSSRLRRTSDGQTGRPGCHPARVA